jgi:hypothetical protein
MDRITGPDAILKNYTRGSVLPNAAKLFTDNLLMLFNDAISTKQVRIYVASKDMRN